MKFELSDEMSGPEAIFQALVAASTCWNNIEGAGVFESTRAREIGEELIRFLRDSEPHLGYATNDQLNKELQARYSIGHIDPEYRTVDDTDGF